MKKAGAKNTPRKKIPRPNWADKALMQARKKADDTLHAVWMNSSRRTTRTKKGSV